MEMIDRTEISGKAHLDSCTNNNKIGLNGARRELEAQVEINFFSFLLLFFLYFFHFLPHKNKHMTKFQIKRI